MAVLGRNLQRRVRVPVARLCRTGAHALAAVGRAGMDVHLTIVGDRTIRALHARYLGDGGATDVLAFNLEAPGPAALLGEVVVSADTAARQARSVGVAVSLELELLVIHGILHLAGYDDHDPDGARRMHRRARTILSRGGARRVPERLWAGLLDTPAPGRPR